MYTLPNLTARHAPSEPVSRVPSDTTRSEGNETQRMGTMDRSNETDVDAIPGYF